MYRMYTHLLLFTQKKLFNIFTQKNILFSKDHSFFVHFGARDPFQIDGDGPNVISSNSQVISPKWHPNPLAPVFANNSQLAQHFSTWCIFSTC